MRRLYKTLDFIVYLQKWNLWVKLNLILYFYIEVIGVKNEKYLTNDELSVDILRTWQVNF
jgi:hypothetical protein